MEILRKLSSINETPRQKYSNPVTANQEIGWFYDVNLAQQQIAIFFFISKNH